MKKAIAIVTTVVMMVSALCQSAVFAAFSDVGDENPYRKAITTLSKLSVIDGYDDGTFKPDGAITRAEFTKLIVYLLGYNDLVYTTNEFADVPENHWAKNFIQTAYNLGIISGMGDGTFAPDSPVTYEQALKMVVCTLGYEKFADAQVKTDPNSWAEGYIKEANALSLTKGISNVSYTAGAPRGVIAQVLYNSLEIEMYENNNYEWVKTEKTLMNDYLKVKRVKGTLIGVEDHITEDCKDELLEDEMAIMTNSGEIIKIDFSEYLKTADAAPQTSPAPAATSAPSASVSDIVKYLGNTITVYYKQISENDDKSLVIIDDETTKNTNFEFKYDDINSFSGNTLKYYDGKKTKTVNFSKDSVTVRYNGKLVGADQTITLKDPDTKEENSYTRQQALELWLNPDTGYTIYGTVKLTDNANDDTIDMIEIYDYDVMVAYTAPTTADYRITDKLVTGNYLILDPQSADYSYTIKKNDANVAVTSIAANDVILYAKSLDGSMYTLIVSNQTVKGSITSINSNGNQMTIGGNTYTIGDTCAAYIKDKDGRELKTGVSGTFYLDSFGTAVFGTLEQSAVAPYGYIADCFIDYDEGGKVYINAYMSNVSGGASSYPLKDKVKLNGSSVKAELAIDRLAETAAYTNKDENFADKIYGAGKAPSLTGYSQPARITIKDGVVTEIITMTSDEVLSQNDDKERIAIGKELNKYTYSSNSFSQDGKTAFSVNSSTIVLSVPGDRSKREKYAKKAVSGTFTSGDAYYVEAYDISSSKVAGLVILYGNDGSLTSVKKDTDFSIVASIPESVYNEETDSNTQKFSVFAGSNVTKSWTTYDSIEFSDVQVGDVIQFAYDSDNLAQGRINNIRFSDIASVLDGGEYNGQKFNWQQEQEPSEENNFQKFKFDYRFKKPGTDEDELYMSSSIGTVPYSRACMYNITQVIPEEKKLYVTQSGFTKADDGSYTIDDSDYEEIKLTSSTKILRMEDDREEISRYAADTTTDLTINDFKDAKNYGVECSKVLICSSKGNAKLIIIYN